MGNIPQPLLIFIVIVVLSAIIGAVSQILRNQQQSEQARASRNRSAERDVAASSGKRQGGSDIDRFLEEIDKLRKKSAGDSSAPPIVAPPPAPVAKRAQRPVAAPLPEVPTVEPRRPKVPVRVEDLPVAPVVTPPLAKPVGASAPPRQPPKTEFAKQLAGLLASGQAASMAVVLNEVLGPPKSRRR